MCEKGRQHFLEIGSNLSMALRSATNDNAKKGMKKILLTFRRSLYGEQTGAAKKKPNFRSIAIAKLKLTSLKCPNEVGRVKTEPESTQMNQCGRGGRGDQFRG